METTTVKAPSRCPHGNEIGHCEKCAAEAKDLRMRRMGALQARERSEGEIADFSPSLSVGYEMSKNAKKRPGSERGQDMFLADRATGLTGVFDGLGGEGGGELASATAAEMMPTIYRDLQEDLTIPLQNPVLADKYKQELFDSQVALLHPSVKEAGRAQQAAMWEKLPREIRTEMILLFQTARKLSAEVAKTNGKTTMTVGRTVEIGGQAYEVIVSLGDSGALKVREDGSVDALAEEDSVLDKVLSMGLVTPEEAKDPDHVVKMPNGKEFAVRDLKKSMFQALGVSDQVYPRVTARLIRPGEKVIYMTDGIHKGLTGPNGEFDPAKVAKLAKPEASARETSDAIVRTAEASEDQDEKTVVVKERINAADKAEEEVEELNPEDLIPEEEIEELKPEDLIPIEDEGKPKKPEEDEIEIDLGI